MSHDNSFGNEGVSLSLGEPPAVETVHAEAETPVFFTCDHASNRIPARLGDLGLAPEQLRSHIGWDIGAAMLARSLAESRSASLVLSGYSRLVIDCNRPLESPGSIPASSAGIAIPGNRDLSTAERESRRNTFFRPYHQAISNLLDRRKRNKVPTVLFSMHSFTPDFPGEERPWHVDFGYNRDRRLARLLLGESMGADILVGDNQPYKVEDDSDYSLPQHGERRGLPHVLIEIRQDTLANSDAVAAWVDRLDTTLRRLAPAIEKLAYDSLSVESTARP
jgi:predicted N-formylglutamate amidohydrolase